MQTLSIFSLVKSSIILVNFSTFSFKTSIESFKSKELELSTTSFEVAPKWTYSPASLSQTSPIALTNAAMSCLV